MKALKWAIASLAIVISLLVIVLNFSSVESRYVCVGKNTPTGGGLPEGATVYIKLEEYRWWVHLWGDSDASLQLEIPQSHVDYFSHVMRVGEQFQIFDSHQNPKMKGNFSDLSKTLALQVPGGFFEGACTKTN